MASRIYEEFLKTVEEDRGNFNARYEERQNNFRKQEEDIQPFFKALENYVKAGELDLDALQVNLKTLNLAPEPGNATSKKGGRRKKMSTHTEGAITNTEALNIKKERVEQSESGSARTSSSSTASTIISKENVKVEMPAPNWIPPAKKGIKVERPSIRSTRTRGKKVTEIRDSDVIFQTPPIPTINLTDTEDSDVDKAQASSRSTRTKTRKQAQAVLGSGAETDSTSESSRSTRTKTKKRNEEPRVEEDEPVETRSTRTKTIRKGKKAEEGTNTDEVEESQPEIRSTRTRTIRKAKEVEQANDAKTEDAAVADCTRSTRTKARRKAENAADEATASKESDKAAGNVAAKEDGQANPKRTRSDSTDEDVADGKDRKKTKSGSPPGNAEANTTAQTVYEDARSTLGPPQKKHLNSTFVTAKPAEPAVVSPVPPLSNAVATEFKSNATVVVEHPKFNIFDKVSTEHLFTDDESSVEVKTPPKKAGPASKTTKEMFSPYEKTSLKKRVEAFERLGQNNSEIPVKTGAAGKSGRDTPSKTRIFTPSGLRFMPSSNSTAKISKFLTQQSNNSTTNGHDSVLTTKSAQKDPRELHKKLQDRDQAAKKKEAMLMAQAEAKRKQNEEKQLKAQQQRKVLEAEKLKQLELQKQKEEKVKQREQEREEYLQKQMEKKRLAQKKKMQEIQAQKQQMQADQARSKPAIYMVTPAPMLPLEDCYDSDDSNYKNAVFPSWCSSDQSKIKQLVMLAAGEKIKNTLFCRRAQTPDLSEIFQTIDPKKLKRSSSILWKRPPRYTMMPDLNETKFSDDDEVFESD